MQKKTVITILFLILSCGENVLEKKEHTYFQMIKAPSNSVHYPEEILKFEFNMEIDPDTLEKIEIEYEKETEKECSVNAEENKIFISDLPAESNIRILFEAGLKSKDHHPLTWIEDDLPNSKDVEFSFKIGPKLPKIESFLPSYPSTSIVLRFDSEIDLTKEVVKPKPLKILGKDKNFLLLFNNHVESVEIDGATTPIRQGSIKEKIFVSGETPPEDEPEFSEIIDDISYSLKVSSSRIFALQSQGKLSFCDGKCELFIPDLEPQTEYEFDISLFTPEGEKKLDKKFTTSEPLPHLMITEVMHTPLGEKETAWEFVEVYNFGSIDFDLQGCTIDDKNDGKGEDPLDGESTTVVPGGTAIIVSSGSKIPEIADSKSIILTVDDTTIADAGLSGSESIQIKCPFEGKTDAFAEYDGSFSDTERGFSVVIDPEGNICSSKKEGGTPGIVERCD